MSMLLKGLNGTEFELAFTRDSLPDAQDGFGDVSWSTVSFRAATADDSWEESSPIINLFEFANLVEWLEDVARAEGSDGRDASGDAGVSEVELLGPELKFSIVHQGAETVTIRIRFQLESRPEEFDVDADTDEVEWLDIRISRAGVLAAAKALRSALDAVAGGTGKDDLQATSQPGAMGEPDKGLNIVDRIRRKPPGAGKGVDNAGNR